MNNPEKDKAYELLQEKHKRHEQILIQAYKSLKQKEDSLKILNNELLASEEELQAINEELSAINDELVDKNEVIHKQNTELQATLKNLKDTQSQLLQSEKMASLGILTAGVAHEINNPLNYIMGSLVGFENYFNEKGITNDEHINYLLESLQTGIEKASAIVQGLGQFSRNSKSNNEDCDLHAVIDNSLLMLHNKMKFIIVVNKKYNKNSIIIKGNVGKIHQVFLNILSNATQAITEKGCISISTKTQNKTAIIKITDSGCGIKPDDLPNIMDPFFTTKPPGKGTGLGLSISYSIIREHKGKLEFKSTLSKGTTAIISLPLNIQ